MPSQLAIPSIADHLRAGKNAIVASRDLFADTRSGAVYDFLMGTAALAWSREALADRDKFRAIYFTTAEGDDLTDFVLKRYGITRILDTYGPGTATFIRPSAAAGAGTIYAGTQIQVSSPNGGATVYQVASNTVVSASATTVLVPIQATTYGSGVAVSGMNGQVIDPLWDNTFSVLGLYCQNGTTYEPAPAFRARVTQTLLDQRPGYPALITQTLQNVGASQVLLFPSNYQSTDHGVNCAYVADQGFSTSQSLLIACRYAVESCRVLGADLQVLPMQSSTISVALTVSLWDDPSKFDQAALTATIASAVVQYFTNLQNAFAYKLNGIAGAAMRVSQAIQTVTVTNPVADATFSSANWPAILTRYIASLGTISVTLTGPI